MLQFVLQKIVNKKWLNGCLLAGIALFTAIFACHPMFEKGADDELLQRAFWEYAEEHNRYPAVFSKGESCDTKEYPTVQAVCSRMDLYEKKWLEYVDVDPLVSQQFISLASGNASSSLGGRNWMLGVGFLRDMEEHIRIVKSMDARGDEADKAAMTGKAAMADKAAMTGKAAMTDKAAMADKADEDAGGEAFPCMVSESVMDAFGMVVGEELSYSNIVNAKGEPARFVITDIFAMASGDRDAVSEEGGAASEEGRAASGEGGAASEEGRAASGEGGAVSEEGRAASGESGKVSGMGDGQSSLSAAGDDGTGVTDYYWYREPKDIKNTIFVSEETMDALLRDYGYETVAYEDALLLDHTKITWRNASATRAYIDQFVEKDSGFSTNLQAILVDYEVQRQNVSVVLWVLELPCLVLLLLFISMVSGQILSTEEGEMAVLRSRGVARGQLVRLYLLQSAVISLAGMILGGILGFFMCRLAAGTDAFLQFTGKDTSLYRVNEWMPVYMLAAGGIAVLFLTLPVWRRSDTTVVQHKDRVVGRAKKPFWQKFFLDVLLLGISLYLLYYYGKQGSLLATELLSEGRMDPMVFLDASLFTFACALLFIRISQYFVRLVRRLGARRWKPAMYASFLQIVRTFSKQGFFTVFLVMTVANGIFDANMARTMNENSEARLRYNTGCDVRLQEMWNKQYYFNQKNKLLVSYEEPDFGVYEQLVGDGICSSMTKVALDPNTDVNASGKVMGGCQLMGIHTKEFGQTAEQIDGLNDTHWFHALNALAEQADGVIISRNLAVRLNLSVGDAIQYARYVTSNPGSDELPIGTADATVCAIVDSFPGYVQYGADDEGDETAKRNGASGAADEGERCLVVANYAQVTSVFDILPYQVWMRMADGHTTEEVAAYVGERGIKLSLWESAIENIEARRSAPLIQITNGLFTMNFLVSLLVCSVGFLLYWIMSIRNREMLFGIYRAMGMRMGELYLMLANEHLFSSLLSIVAGVGAGSLTTFFFTRLTALVYLPEKHNIGIRTYIYATDMLKLAIVLSAVVLLCLVVLCWILRKMKIARALKLGED